MIWTARTATGTYTVQEQIEPEDEPGILDLFSACDDWFEAVTGGPSGPGDVQSLFYSLPEGSSFDDKRLFTVRDEGRIIGLVDAVLGHPHRRCAAVGLFLLAPSHRRSGLGTAVSRVLLHEARLAGLDEVTASANDTWEPGTAFLCSLGFTIGEPVRESGNRTIAAGEAVPRRAMLSLT